MKTLIVIALLSSSVFSADFGAQKAFMLEAGKKSFTLNNSGPQGGTLSRVVGIPAAWDRVGVVVIPGIFVPPTPTTTFTDCTDPCGVSGTVSQTTTNLQSGQSYIWNVRLNTDGTTYSPFTVSAVAGAYSANQCGGVGTIPQIAFPVVTTSPLQMPIEVIGQDCYETAPYRFALKSGHASTSIRLFFRVYALVYNTTGRYDGKISIQINGGAWLPLTNANSNVVPVDEAKYYNRAGTINNSANDAVIPIGGIAQVREYTLALTSNPIGSSDTTYDIKFRFNGTEGIVSGSRILEAFPIEGTDKTVTQIVCSSNVCVGTSNSHGFSSGESILILGAPGLRALDGPQVLTSVTTNTFTFTPHAQGSGGSRPEIYVVPDGTYTVPVDRSFYPTVSSAQPVMRASRMLVATTAFTYPDGSQESAPAGGDATKGRCLFIYGNESCTPGEHNLVNPMFAHGNYRLTAQCASCHAGGPTSGPGPGWDLQYYKFSNYSIKARSVFHGLTDAQGDHIAAYIRSLNAAAPYQAYPWNPPFQPGPGMDQYTWKRLASGSTMTAILCGASGSLPSNTCKATGLSTTAGVKLTDPVLINGVTGDTDLNTQTTASTTWRITAFDATSITFTTTNVTDGTYNNTGIVINLANNFAAGCGVDCVVQYAYNDMLYYFGTDKSKWVYNSWLDARLLPLPWQLPDWNKFWLPAVYPGDSYPSAGFEASIPNTHYQTLLSCVTPGNFASYKSCGYMGASSPDTQLFDQYLNFTDRQFEGNSVYRLLTPSRLADYPNQQNLFRNSTAQTFLLQQWTMSVEYQTIGMDAQRQTDLHGAATATGCYRQWGLPLGIFTSGAHKYVLDGVLNGQRSDFNNQSNIMYIWTPLVEGNCYGGPDSPVDYGYINDFLDEMTQYRPSGYAVHLMEQVIVTQLGSQFANFARMPNSGDNGQQGVGPLVGYLFGQNYWFFTQAEYVQLINDLLDMMATQNAAHDAAYWSTQVTHYGTDCNGAWLAWPGNQGSSCDNAAMFYTIALGVGANSTKVSAYRTFIDSISALIPAWAAHDWDADAAAGVEGNLVNGATGDLSVPQLNTVTFSTCPGPLQVGGMFSSPVTRQFVINSTGGELPEILFPTFGYGGACNSAGGGTGTLKFTTTRAHTGTLKISLGLGPDINPYPNWTFGTPVWFRGKNMFLP